MLFCTVTEIHVVNIVDNIVICDKNKSGKSLNIVTEELNTGKSHDWSHGDAPLMKQRLSDHL